MNADGVSQWQELKVRTSADPLENAICGIKAECTVPSQGGEKLDKLFDFDDKDGSLWHTKYSEKAVPFELVIDLASEYDLDKMVYLPRTNAGNDTILKGTVEVSTDKAVWTEAGKFSWERSNKEKEFTFPEICVKTRYVRIKVTKAVGDFGSGREMFVFKKGTSEGKQLLKN